MTMRIYDTHAHRAPGNTAHAYMIHVPTMPHAHTAHTQSCAAPVHTAHDTAAQHNTAHISMPHAHVAHGNAACICTAHVHTAHGHTAHIYTTHVHAAHDNTAHVHTALLINHGFVNNSGGRASSF